MFGSRISQPVVKALAARRVFFESQSSRSCRQANHLPDLARGRRHQIVLAVAFFQRNEFRHVRQSRIEIAAQSANDPDLAAACQRIQDIDNALNNAFAQRQVSLIYTPRNQYRIILETDPVLQRDPAQIESIYVPGFGATQVPLKSVIRIERGLAPLVINHQGQFPAVTISFSLAPDVTIEQATRAVDRAVAELQVPDTLHAEFQGEARAYRQSLGAQPLLILAALFAVYIVLGVLYESLAHPLTIISTLPSAGLGALLALQLFQTELSLIAFIGIILLIGIVKKNGIIMVDFALDAERNRGLAPEQAIFDACLERFRPILMTTLAALLGALPLVFGSGPGSELRRPLGITIVGGLIVSQMLTLYTTPVIYLLLDRLHRRLWGVRVHREPGQGLRAAARMLKP